MAKRSKLQVVHDILSVIQSGKTKPTHILYKANLSHSMMESYLEDLIKKGMVREIEDKKGKNYNLTDKGYKFLTDYNKMTGFLDAFGLGD